ncbi:MAG: Rieske 2Fe-2S domain-containing protein [Hyphomonadaceae bacterium]|nr:Rieske 2Fe-2S domain-containing protein [Hyphomonadaceae bacterium]
MLSAQDNERLVRVGPGTPCGNFMRRYWQPALLSAELPEKDGAPLRVRLLGEDLLAFRNTDGAVGLVDALCPHRRAPLFFGRNEECGIRCVYHGWKFDVAGNCVDMPSEPVGTPLQKKVKLRAYPTVERGGIVWAYLGPPELKPAPPNYEWLRAPDTHRRVSKTFEACNYLQAMEGGLDTAHSSFVHNNKLDDTSALRTRDRAPRIEVEPTDYGYWYTSTRTYDAASVYLRLYHFVLPHGQVRGGFTKPTTGERADVPKLDGHIWVPIDDETTYVYNWACGFDQSVPITPEYWREFETFCGRGPNEVVPGTFRLKRTLANDYLIDRQVQKTRTYTGIEGLNTQDFALQEGMGPIVDRSKEFLGTSDRAIILMRRMLLENIAAVERGDAPAGADPRASENVRAFDGLAPAGAKWQVAFAEHIRPRW